MKQIFKVCIPHTYRDHFDYYSEHSKLHLGARVWVPFRKKTRMGVIVGQREGEASYANMKSITEVIDAEPLLSGELLALCFWVSRYYQSPLSEVIPLAIPKKYRKGDDHQKSTDDYYQLAVDPVTAKQLLKANAHRQHALVDFFSMQQQPLSSKMLLQAGFAKAQIDNFLSRGMLTVSTLPEASTNLFVSEPLPLHPEQAIAVKTISQHLDAYHCFLLQGVTGSGKTEVYLQVIASVLASGRQALIIVPEIGLTPQLLDRFRERFQVPMVVVHSQLNDTERQQAWESARLEEAKLVIGTRTAVFTPMPGLGLIVVDEEHDASLKQMEGVRYSARDTALMRAHLRHVPIILGSATPSLESLYNCSIKKYTCLRLNQKALTNTPLHFQIIDIRNQPLQHGLANTTLNVIKTHLEQKNQVLVFINRRGFAPVLLCHHCGWMADCRGCDAHLTLHRPLNRLICHHCGLVQKVPERCKQCQHSELIPVGAGTQRIYEFLNTQFPTTSILRIDRDQVQRKDAFNHYLSLINKGEAQLIVGTQMLAKGHHFPRLSLVVVLDTDNGFYNQDFRAMERLGQLITQVAGRAGRAEHAGQVVIQTYLPQHPLLNLLVKEGYDAFAHSLLMMRQRAALPPFQFLSVIRAQSQMLPRLLNFLHELKQQLQLHELSIFGPAPAPLARKAGVHRMQLLVKSSSRKKLQFALTQMREWSTMNNIVNGIRWNVDVDPIDLS